MSKEVEWSELEPGSAWQCSDATVFQVVCRTESARLSDLVTGSVKDLLMGRRRQGTRAFRGLWIALTIAGTALPCVPTPSRFGPSTPNFSQFLKYELLTLTGGVLRSPHQESGG